MAKPSISLIRASALAAAAIAIGLMFSTATLAAGSRGVTVNLKASEAANAAVSDTVQLYGASHALVIGIDKYTNGWSRLSNAVGDARVVAMELERQGFQVSLKTDLNADNLRKTLREFFAIKGADPDARLLLWYAGHGHTIGGEGFMVPADTPPDTSPAFLVSALPMRDFGSLVRLARSKHVLSIFDSCFSGTIFQARAGATPRAITKKTTKPVRQFITSGDAGQQVRDDGSFREYFVRALTGEEKADFNNDGYVTGEELGLFLNQQMTALTSAAQTPKSGKLHDVKFNQGDFVFVLPGGAAAARAAPGSGITAEVAFWQSIQDSTDPEMFAEYFRQYPKGSFGGLARLKVRKLQGPKVAPPPQATFSVRDMDGSYVAVKRTNVRARPDATGQKLTTLDVGAAVSVSGQVEGKDWYRITLADGTGFVWSPLLEDREAYERKQDAERARAEAEQERLRVARLAQEKAERVRAEAEQERLRVARLAQEKAEQERRLRVAEEARKRAEEEKHRKASLTPGEVFRDCDGVLVASAGPGLPPGASFCGPQMVVVPAGSFEMGSNDGDNDEKPVHHVTIQRPFAVGVYEVTQAEWRSVLGNNPNGFTGDRNPVDFVSWDDAKDFLKRLSAKTGKEYRLLSEAEWEYAARAGSRTKFPWGNDMDLSMVNYGGKGPVGSYGANAFGLYDTIGNAMEWTEDCWNANYKGAPSNGAAWKTGNCNFRIIRSAPWRDEYEDSLRSSNRTAGWVGPRYGLLGFRIARSLPRTP